MKTEDTINILLKEAKASNVSYGQIRADAGGNVFLTFRLRNGDAYLPHITGEFQERIEAAAQWMRDNGLTNRGAFFAGFGTRSANLHSLAIKQLVRTGELERIGREYVFKEGH